jgi:hypothetical protein
MKTFCLLLAILPPTWADAITMDFTGNMQWRYDLSTSASDPTFQPFSMNIQAVVDDTCLGVVLATPTATRIAFGGVSITSPLSTLVNLGVDVSNLPYSSTDVLVQDQSGSAQATWTTLADQQFSTSGGGNPSVSRTLEFNNDPRITNFLTFGSADLDSFLLSHLGDQWDYREDSLFPRGGFQNYGIATLTDVTISPSAVPEPSYAIGVATMLFGLGRVAYKRALDRRRG